MRRLDRGRILQRLRQVEQVARLLDRLRLRELVDIADADARGVAVEYRPPNARLDVLRRRRLEGEAVGAQGMPMEAGQVAPVVEMQEARFAALGVVLGH